jgi:hypothetical protein
LFEASFSLFGIAFSVPKTLVVLLMVLVLASLDIAARARRETARYILGVVVGTALGVGLILFSRMLLLPDITKQGQVMAAGILMIIVAWRLLFGTWDPRTKATVLGTVVFWILFTMIGSESSRDRLAHAIAIAIALLPAAIWSIMFLSYHVERRSVVLALFFAGMLSTVPILFYDALVRHQVELHFFLFRVVPESFNSSAQVFVRGTWSGVSQLQSSLLGMFVSFLLVGVIEEGSKFWVLARTSKQYVRSIDDALQMAILVAIGFAFAENITSTGYFLSFVREYLFTPATPQWSAFLGNIAGRSVLTSMVHIVSTGVMGYYLGVATFAGPLLEEQTMRGIRHWIIDELHQLFGIERRRLFARMKMITGFSFAVLLHATCNFLVSLPDALPGHPKTFGDLFHAAPGSPLHFVTILLVPTMAYVLGGFLLLTWLFQRKENMRDRGHLISAETYLHEQQSSAVS